MKAIWSGSLAFGLVNIPIKLYSAIKNESTGFTLLCGSCQNPIKYKRWCAHCKKDVSWENVVKGLKATGDKYIILTQEKIAQLRPDKRSAIDIVEFIDYELFEPIYFHNHYYLGPAQEQAKPFFLFREVLEVTGKVAIGQLVMKDKEYVVSIMSYKKGILLSTLHYGYQIRAIEEVPYLVETTKISSAELSLAKKLIDQRTKRKFNIQDFKDTFIQELKKALKTTKATKISTKDKKARKQMTYDQSLMDALKASVATRNVTEKSVGSRK